MIKLKVLELVLLVVWLAATVATTSLLPLTMVCVPTVVSHANMMQVIPIISATLAK